MGVTHPTASWHPLRLAREAFSGTFQGSRRDLAEVTAWRVQAAVLFVWLAGRCAHLAQAGIDLAVGHRVYTNPGLAEGLAAACLIESLLFAAVTVRAQRLTLGALLGDAAFGVAGLAVMSAATIHMAGRSGSLNWMLPYTVATVVGLGWLSSADRGRPGRAGGAGRAGRRGWLLAVAQAVTVAALAAAYILSVYLPRRLPADKPAQLWQNDANYAGFFLAAVVVALLARRWLALIGERNAEAARQAADLSQEAHWRALTIDVFGPVLELLDSLAVVVDVVPASARAEAGRLIGLIEAVKPRETGAAAVVPGAGGGGLR